MMTLGKYILFVIAIVFVINSNGTDKMIDGNC